MPRQNKSASPPSDERRRLPASIIFTPTELKHYRRWQRQTTSLKPQDQGLLPSAFEYADFKAWLARRDSGCFTNSPFDDIAAHVRAALYPNTGKDEVAVATKCRHVLHPAAQDEEVDRCPVCTIEAHMRYMNVLTRALEFAEEIPRDDRPKDDVYCQAWYAGKLKLVQEVCRLENRAAEEADWMDKNPGHPIVGSKTATQALRMYWASIEYSGAKWRPAGRGVKEKRSVSFGEDTSFTQGRDLLYFCRRSPRYEAGKYAIEGEEDADDEDEEVGEEVDNQSKVSWMSFAEESEYEDDSDDEWESVEDEDSFEEVEGAEFIVFE